MKQTVKYVWDRATQRLETAGVEHPGLEARLLLEHATGLSGDDIILGPERALAANVVATFDSLIERRLNHEPAARITGRQAFWGLDLLVSPAVRLPGAAMEAVVTTCTSHSLQDRARLRIVELGTGCGAILLALLEDLPGATGIGFDPDGDAVALAQENASRMGLGDRAQFQRGGWNALPGLGRFNTLVSSPPNVPTAEIDRLPPEIRNHDPRATLDGGEDGLDAYRAIAGLAPGLLSRGGEVFLGINDEQANPVAELLRGAGLREPTAHPIGRPPATCLSAVY